ncbi:MAG: DUF998 domain-containing protein [Candidatus Heimdallarchaeota archaeon]|nr:DUF998 domain-containing protein [Candidatus Heimdallarchaeota archaeon]
MTSDQEKILISQKKLKLIVGGMGVGLPTALFLGNFYIHNVEQILGSISSYYHSSMRDVFVGVLFAVGVFMIAYEGYSAGDRLLSTLGGSLAIVVALFPTTPSGDTRDTIGTIHLVAAAGFFLILGIFCMFLFTKSDSEIPKTGRKKIRNFIYYLCGLSLFASLILLILTESSIMDKPIEDSTFWLEYIANTAFGTAWLIKGEGIFFLNDDPILDMSPWELLGILILLILGLGSGLMLSTIFF